MVILTFDEDNFHIEGAVQSKAKTPPGVIDRDIVERVPHIVPMGKVLFSFLAWSCGMVGFFGKMSLFLAWRCRLVDFIGKPGRVSLFLAWSFRFVNVFGIPGRVGLSFFLA